LSLLVSQFFYIRTWLFEYFSTSKSTT